MSTKEILEILRRAGAVITDSHIVYTSGKHGSAYINKDAVYPHTELTSRLCRSLAESFRWEDVGTVVAPVLGGVILSQWVAYHLSAIEKREVFGVYAEKEDDGFVFHRGYEKLVSGRRVLVVEDILNTGGSARKVVESVRKAGGTVVGVGALVNRGGVTAAEVGNPGKLLALLDLRLDAFEAEACPLCRSGIPVNTDVGKGKEFLASHRKA